MNKVATPKLQMIGAVVVGFSLSACLDSSPDVVELSNIRTSNIVPKSSPTSFVSTFEKLCLGPLNSKQGFEKTLRNASYVPTRRRDARGYRYYVVDDRRPAVLVREQGSQRGCAVIAKARTGQTQRVRNAIPRLFPKAARLSTSAVAGAEQVWADSSTTKRVIFTSRDQNPFGGANYRLAIIETK